MAFKVGAIVSKLTLDKSGWNQSMKEVGADQKKMQGMSDKTAAKFKKVGRAMTVAGAAIVAGFGAAIKASEKQAIVEKQLEAVLKSTGHAAGLTKDELLEMAAALQDVTTYGDETIIGAQNLLLTFTKIGKEVFPEALETVLDMSTALGQDLKSSAIQMGKALNDPIKGMTALSRVGVAFTEDQIKMVKQMVATGNTLDAQKLILAELSTEFGGSARAAAETFTGQLQQLKNDAGDLAERIGSKLVPILKDMVAKVKPVVENIIKWVDENPKLVETIVKITAGAGALMLVLGPILMIVPKLVVGVKALAGAFTFLLSPVGLVVAALAALAIGYMKVKAAQDAAEKSTRTAAEQEAKLFEKLKESAEQAGMTAEEFDKLKESYDDNAAALAMAIKRGDEGVEMQKALAEHTSDYEVEAVKAAEASKELDVNIKDLNIDLTKYDGLLEDTKEKAKTWTDYIKSMGVTTIQEKGTRVKQLTGYLKDLKKAYDEGKLSLKDYVESTNAANKEIEELSTTIIDTIPLAGRQFDLTFGEMTTRTSDFVVETEKKTGEFTGLWRDSFDFIGQSAKDNLKRWLGGYQTFGDTLKNIWTDLKDTFINNLVEMGTSFAKDFIGSMVSSAKEGFGTVVDSVKNLGKGVVNTIKGFSPGGIAQGVISGAVGGLVTGLMGAAKDKQRNKFLQEISENTWNTKNLLMTDYKAEVHTSQNLLRDIFSKVESLNPKTDATNRILRNVEKNTKPLSSMISAQEGAVITQPTLGALHGSQADPEIVSPVSKIIEGLKGFGGASASLRQAINVVINVKDQLDPYVAQKIVRNQIVPNILKAIEIDAGNKTKMREILGVQV